jgi:aldose 1-epimerase
LLQQLEKTMIELSSSGYKAWILPERGGNCIRLSRFDVDVLRTPASDSDLKATPFFYGTPILFFPNRISGGQFEFEGRYYRFEINEPASGCYIHGTLHETEFRIMDQLSDEATLYYEATDDRPYLTFPHSFSVQINWRLSDGGLRQLISITNLSGSNMPTALAFHTTFRLPFGRNGRAEDIIMQLDTSCEYSRNMKNYLPDGQRFFDYPLKKEMEEGTYHPASHLTSRFFRMGDKKQLVLFDPVAGIQATYQALQGYGYWMLYNGISTDFLCVEPQSWLSNCPNAPFPRNETGFDYLVPGETRHYETNLRIEKRNNLAMNNELYLG